MEEIFESIVQTLFKPGRISENFYLYCSIASYVVCDALGISLKKVLINEMKTSNSLFALEFDETTTAKSEKQFDVIVRLWSSSREDIIVMRNSDNSL